MEYITLLTSIFFTIIFYLIVPIILFFLRKKYSKKKIVIIILLNGAAVWVLFNVIRVIIGEPISTNVAPAFLWSIVGYSLLNKTCLESEGASSSKQDANFISNSQEKITNNILYKDKNIIKEYRSKLPLKKSSVIIFLLSMILITSIILNFVQYNENLSLYDDLVASNNKLAEYNNDISGFRNKVKLQFYEKNVAIVSNDGTRKYHIYGCDDCDLSRFWIYNIAAAEEKGYYACPKCH